MLPSYTKMDDSSGLNYDYLIDANLGNASITRSMEKELTSMNSNCCVKYHKRESIYETEMS